MDSVRVDKWLWAARCFKTRTRATAACDGGHVQVNGLGAKASRSVKIGDRVEALTPGGACLLEVGGLADRRGSAAIARTLYVDHTPPPPEKVEPPMRRERGQGRPTKRERRRLGRLWGDDR